MHAGVRACVPVCLRACLRAWQTTCGAEKAESVFVTVSCYAHPWGAADDVSLNGNTFKPLNWEPGERKALHLLGRTPD